MVLPRLIDELTQPNCQDFAGRARPPSRGCAKAPGAGVATEPTAASSRQESAAAQFRRDLDDGLAQGIHEQVALLARQNQRRGYDVEVAERADQQPHFFAALGDAPGDVGALGKRRPSLLVGDVLYAHHEAPAADIPYQ